MHEAIQGYMFINNPFVHSSVVFKANLLQSNSLYNSKYDTAEDYELFARHVFKWRFANIPDYLTIYRASDKQNTKQQQLAKEIRNNLLLSIIDATEQEKELHYLFSENIAGLKMETIKAWAGKLRFAQHEISTKYLSKSIQQQAWHYFKKNYFTSSSLFAKLSELLQSGMPTAYIAKSLVKIFLNKPL